MLYCLFFIFLHSNKNAVKKYIALAILTLIPIALDAQSFYRRRRDRDFVVSYGMGTASYFGELKNDGDLLVDNKLNMEFGLEYQIHPRFSPKLMVTLFRLQGDDRKADKEAGRESRNLRFRSDNVEVAIIGIAQLYEARMRYYQRPQFNIYAFGGLAATWYSPRADIPEQDYNGNPFPDAGKFTPLRKLKTELVKYGAVTIALPVGFGIRYKINPWFNIAIDGGYRLTFTDYLDDVSTVHAGSSAFSDPLAQAMADRRPELDRSPALSGAKRGNPDKNDGYFLWNVKVEYYLQSLFGVQSGAIGRRQPRSQQ